MTLRARRVRELLIRRTPPYWIWPCDRIQAAKLLYSVRRGRKGLASSTVFTVLISLTVFARYFLLSAQSCYLSYEVILFTQILIFDVALYLTVFSSDSGPANFNFSIHRQPVTKESRYSRVADCRLIAATVVPFAPRIAWCPTNRIREHSGMTHHAVTVGLVKLNGYLG